MKKIILITCVVLVLAMGSTIAFACATPGKGSSGITIWPSPVNDYCWAQVDKCNCTPVDNKLFVKMNVQYEMNNQYIWTGEMTKSMSDSSQAKLTKNVAWAQYVKASGTAKCGTGAIVSYTMNKSR